MAGTFKFELVSPARLLLAVEAEQVVVPGGEGDFAILAGHAPFLSTLRPGLMEVRLPDGKQHRIFVRGGFAEADQTSLTVLAQEAFDVDDMDRAWLDRKVKNAEDDVADAKDDEALMNAQTALSKLRELQAAV